MSAFSHGTRRAWGSGTKVNNKYNVYQKRTGKIIILSKGAPKVPCSSGSTLGWQREMKLNVPRRDAWSLQVGMGLSSGGKYLRKKNCYFSKPVSGADTGKTWCIEYWEGTMMPASSVPLHWDRDCDTQRHTPSKPIKEVLRVGSGGLCLASEWPIKVTLFREASPP